MSLLNFSCFYIIFSTVHSEINIDLVQNVIESYKRPLIATALLCNNNGKFNY